MPINFVPTAQKQINPLYKPQEQALQAQIPAIQQLYQSLNQGLLGQQAAGNQNILEGAAGRGLLRSTIPVDQQAALAGSTLQQQAQLGSQQGKEVAGVNQQIGGLGVEKANAISQLVNTLFNRDLEERKLQYSQQQQNQSLALQRALADRQYQFALQSARL